MITKGRKKGTVRFSLTPGNGADKVQLAGDFTGWQPKPLRKNKAGEYVSVVPLAPGTYEYKFIVDGQWVMDPDNSSWAANSFGTFNSVCRVED